MLLKKTTQVRTHSVTHLVQKVGTNILLGLEGVDESIVSGPYSMNDLLPDCYNSYSNIVFFFFFLLFPKPCYYSGSYNSCAIIRFINDT